MAYGAHASNIRVRKVTKIFSKFDANKDGHLSREEMAALVVAVNPKVDFNEEQIAAILDEIFRTYGDYIDGSQGLSFDGLLQTYYDGAGDIDRDFNALGLELDKEDELPTKDGPNGSHVDAASSADESSRRMDVVGSWAGSPTNGIVYDSTWELIEELELQIRELEGKIDKRNGGISHANDLCIVSVGWARNMSSVDGSATSQVVIGKRPWEDLGPDYMQFQRQLVEIRKKADQSPTQDEAFDTHMATGRTLFNHRLYKEALLSFKRAGEVRPADARPHFQGGNTLFALGNISDAREAYTLALNAGEPDGDVWGHLLPQIHINLGIALESEGMLICASEHYKEAAIREPKHYRALKLLGSALYGVGEYKAAKEALLEAISLYADYTDAHCELGSVLHALGDHDQAITEFEKALILRSDHMEALYNLATLFKDIGQYRRAANAYLKVLALQPDHWRAQLNRAVSLMGAGDIDESKRAFKAAYKMTGRSELYDAMVHLQYMEKRPQGMSSFLQRGDVNSGIVGDSFGGEENFTVVELARFRGVDERTTPRELLASALHIRQFQNCTKFNRCDVANVMNQTLLHSSSALDGTPEKVIRKEALERVVRHLLPFLKPEAYQGAMKLVNERVLAVLDSTESGRVDLGMVLAVLAPVCRGSPDSRKRAAFHALVFRSSRIIDGEVSKQDAKQYLRVLRAAYLRPQEEINHDETFGHATNHDDMIGNEAYISISFPEFVQMFDDLDCGFGVLKILTKLETGDHIRHVRHTCSVCCYPIIGPRFKETKLNFSLCSLCYSIGRVPSSAKHEEFYHFKEVNSELGALKDKLQSFKSPCTSRWEL